MLEEKDQILPLQDVWQDFTGVFQLDDISLLCQWPVVDISTGPRNDLSAAGGIGGKENEFAQQTPGLKLRLAGKILPAFRLPSR